MLPPRSALARPVRQALASSRTDRECQATVTDAVGHPVQPNRPDKVQVVISRVG
jgi:hypothetical protein